jgi:hypothetical protein
MSRTLTNILTNLNSPAFGSIITLMHSDQAGTLRAIGDSFREMNGSTLATTLELMCNYSSGFETFSLFLKPALSAAAGRDIFCANDLHKVIVAIAMKVHSDKEHFQSSNISQNQAAAAEFVGALLSEYSNKRKIDLLYLVNQGNNLPVNALNFLDEAFEEHLVRDGCYRFSLKQNTYFYADIFARHHMPRCFEYYFALCSSSHERMVTLYNTIAKTNRLSAEYAAGIDRVMSTKFLLDLSFEDIYENGNVNSYNTICGVVDEDLVILRDQLEDELSVGKISPLLNSLIDRTYLTTDQMPMLFELMIKNLPEILKIKSSVSCDSIAWRANDLKMLPSVWHATIKAARHYFGDELAEDEAILNKMAMHFNQYPNSRTEPIVNLAYLAISTLRKMTTEEYPANLFKVNDEGYKALSRALGPLLTENEQVKLKFVNAKRAVLSEDFGL